MSPRAPLAFLMLLAASAASAGEPPLHERYREAAARITGAALQSDHAYERLAVLCDRHGHRLSGSPRLEAAIDWCLEEMRADGFRHVRRQPVMVPRWVRGEESAAVVSPQEHELRMLGLGGSVGTPEGGLVAEAVVVEDFEELEALGREKVQGRIVVYDAPFTSYGETVKYRVNGARRAAKLGAVASLVRSVGPASLDTPHTGGMSYEEGVPKIPHAAITIEGATLLHRLHERGDRPVVRLEMNGQTLPDSESANVIAELVGSELPHEVVVVGGHVDAWDVGQGAQDDGAGCVIAWEAARLIHELGLKPRRTIRVVLWTNEENGTRGAKAYANEHAIEDHVAVFESDSGNGPAAGFRLHLPDGAPEEAKAEALRLMEELAVLLRPLGSGRIRTGGSGADAGYCVKKGAVGLGLDHDTSEYFKIHHTPADTFDKIVKKDLDENVATMAIAAFVLADMPGRLLPHSPPAPPEPERATASFSRR